MKAKRSRCVVTYLRGGLGNQLFQWATGYAVARRTARELVLSTALIPMHKDEIRGVSRWPFMLDQLGDLGYALEDHWFQPDGGTSRIGKGLSAIQLAASTSQVAAFLAGIITSEDLGRLDSSNRRRIRLIELVMSGSAAREASPFLSRQLRILSNPSDAYLSLQSYISRTKPNIAHLRSGDYESMRHLYGTLGRQYWVQAAQLYDDQRPLLVFTDAPNAEERVLEEGIRADLVVGTDIELSPVETLSLMTLGSTFTGSNSTFSWWAATLGDPARQIVLPNSGAPNSIFSLGDPSPSCIWLQTH